jgi:hypothetical protein
MPSGWKAVTTAENLLSVTDPACKNHGAQNVQSSKARLEIANRIGMYTISPHVVGPIESFPLNVSFYGCSMTVCKNGAGSLAAQDFAPS